MSTFTLHHLLLACMLTGITVSIIVTSIHSQWNTIPQQHGENIHSPMNNLIVANSQTHLLRTRIESLKTELELVRQQQSQSGVTPSQTQPPPTPSTPTLAPCATCPTCTQPAPQSSSNSIVPIGSSSSSSLTPTEAAFEEYINLHKSILARESGVEQKFIVARPQAQMNNRLRVIVGGIALGMLTKRAFLIEFSDGYYASLEDCFDTPIDMDLKHFDRSRIGGGGKAMNMEDVETMLCTDYNQHFTGLTIDLGTPPNLIPFFWRNSAHHSQLRRWFGYEDMIYRLIAKYFLRPSKVVNEMMFKFRNKNDWPIPTTRSFVGDATASLVPPLTSRTRIGIHLRWGGDMRPQPIREEEWSDMVGCVGASIPRSILTSKQAFDIFVAADTDESRIRAEKELSLRFPSARILFYETWLRSNTPQGVQAALTELLLLSECDHLVLTPASSYGEQAMVLHGKPAYFIRSTVPNPARIQFTVTHEITKNCLRPYGIQPTIEHFSQTIKKATCYHPDMQAIAF